MSAATGHRPQPAPRPAHSPLFPLPAGPTPRRPPADTLHKAPQRRGGPLGRPESPARREGADTRAGRGSSRAAAAAAGPGAGGGHTHTDTGRDRAQGPPLLGERPAVVLLGPHLGSSNSTKAKGGPPRRFLRSMSRMAPYL